MSLSRSSVFLGLSLGVLIVAVAIVGAQVYYNPNVTNPTNANYSVEPINSGFLVSVEPDTQLSDSVTVQLIREGTDSEDINVTPPESGDPVYLDPESPISEVQAVSINYEDEQLYSSFITESLTEQLSVRSIGNITVKPNQQLRLSIEDFVSNNQSIKSYSWDTGVRVMDNRDFIQTYEDDNTYPASLVVTDTQGRTYRTDFNVVVGVGSEDTRSVELPNSNVSVNVEPESVVKFESAISKDTPRIVEQYRWDFDNGIVGYGESVLNKYSEDGVYNVTLNVSYTNGDTEVHSFNVTVTDDPISDIYVSGSSGYQFEFTADLETGNPEDYTWRFGDGSVLQGSDVVSYEYDEYGSYEVTLEAGNETYRKEVTTEVLVEMGSEPYVVEQVSGNHSEQLIQSGSVGEENPSLAFQEGIRYRITGLPVDTEFKSRAGVVLLSQDGDGVFESDHDVKWREVSDDTVVFTVTEELGERLASYEPVGDGR